MSPTLYNAKTKVWFQKAKARFNISICSKFMPECKPYSNVNQIIQYYQLHVTKFTAGHVKHSSKAQQHSWTTMIARWQHGCLWQEPCMDVSMMELSKRRTLEGQNREEGNGKPPRLFSLDMTPIDGCFEDVLQLWPLFFDVNCCLPPVIDGWFKDVLQQWPLFFVVDCHLPSDGSHWPAQKRERQNVSRTVQSN